MLIAGVLGFLGGAGVVGFVWFLRSEIAAWQREQDELQRAAG